MKTPQTSLLKRFRVVALTITGLAIAFFLYFYVFVEGKRTNLYERAFRVLNQNQENLRQKDKTILISYRSFLSYYLSYHLLDSTFLRTNLIFPEQIKSNPSSIRKYQKAVPVGGLDSPAIFNLSKRDSLVLLDSIRKYFPLLLDSIRRERPFTSRRNKKLKVTDVQYTDTKSDFLPTSNLSLQGAEPTLTYWDTTSVIKLYPASRRKIGKVAFKFQTPLKDVIDKALIGRDLFDEYLLIKDNAVVYETFPSGLKISQQDSLFSTGRSVISGNVLNANLSGEDYKLFVQRIRIGALDEFVLCGAMKEKHYQAEIYTISLLAVVLVIALLLILALGYPFFKLSIMSRGERLRTGDAFFSIFSVVAGAFVVTLIFLSLYAYWFPDWDRRDTALRDLSTSIQDSLHQELHTVYQQLEAYRATAAQHPGLFADLSYGYQKSVLDGKSRRNPLKAGEYTDVYPRYYPYFKDVFWVDSAAYTREEWTTTKQTSPSVYVSDREYFKKIVEERPWSLSDSTSSKPFMLQPIFNRADGVNLAVVSIKFDTLPLKIKRPVLALETRLHSVIEPVLPLGYGFCIIDLAGTVWFHSDQKKNLQEQFMKECGDDKGLRAIMRGNAAQSLKLTYNGQEYWTFASPLQHMPLYLLVFHRDEHYNTISSLVLSTTFMCYVLFLLPMAMLLIMHWVSFPHNFRLKGESFALSWLSPRNKRTRLYHSLVLVFTILALLELLVLGLSLSETDTLVFYALIALISFSVARALLYERPHRKTQWLYHGTYFVLFMLLNAHLFRSGGKASSKLLGVLSLVAALGVELFVRFKKQPLAGTPAAEDNKPTLFDGLLPGAQPWSLQVSYILCSFIWVLVLAVLPAFAFYKLAYNSEQQLDTARHLMHMAHDLTNRKERLEDEFRDIEGKKQVIPGLIATRGRYDVSANPTTINIYQDKVWARGLDTTRIGTDYRDTLQLDLRFQQIRKLYSWIAAESYELLFPENRTSEWHWHRDSKNSLVLNYQAYDWSHADNSYILLAASPNRFWLPLPFHRWGLACWIPLLIILLSLYGLIRYAVKHLFNLGLFDMSQPESVKAEVITHAFFKERKNLFLVGAYLPDDHNFVSASKQKGLTVELIDLQRKESKPENSSTRVGIRLEQNGQLKFVTEEEATPNSNGSANALIITHFEAIARGQVDSQRLTSLANEVSDYKRQQAGIPILIVSTQNFPVIRNSAEEWAQKLPEDQQLAMSQALAQWEWILSDFQEQCFHLNTNVRWERQTISREFGPMAKQPNPMPHNGR